MGGGCMVFSVCNLSVSRIRNIVQGISPKKLDSRLALLTVNCCTCFDPPQLHDSYTKYVAIGNYILSDLQPC